MENGGSYRVLVTNEADGFRLLNRETHEQIVTASEGHDAPISDLHPGYCIDADLDWTSTEPSIWSFSIQQPTLYSFVDHIDPVFEAAQQAWQNAQLTGDSMNSQVTRNTDNEVNGVLYVFAEDGRDGMFESFRDGSRPLDPLVDKVNEQEGDDPREVFVLRPESGAFVIVIIALEKGGQFADTLRETYDCPRPIESLA
ncbi:DUF6663 family protein [Haladaptatus cibarius]|uniref:DUF6663 family protein n=1 Tax=Haladaptatus cibarius TaxID=453847 RepID=UPI000678F4D4|nr:DUF6663 family protein [Haladaptatus cibarius]